MESYSVEAILKASGASQFSKDFQNASKSVQGIDKSAKNASISIGSMLKAIAGSAVVIGAFNGIRNSVDGAISRFDTLQTFPNVMQMMRFSATDSEKAIKRLADGIDGLPTALDEVTGTAQRLATMTGDLDGAVETTLALNNAFLASGASSADASRGLEQYVQMLATGAVDLQSWRSLQETMPIALNKVAEAFGYTGRSAQNDLYEALKAGEITFDEFNSKIIELSSETGGFADLARESSTGIRTSWQNVRTAVVKGVADMIGSIDEALSSFGGISGVLDRFKSGIQAAFGWINANIPIAINYFKEVYNAIKPWLPLITSVVAAFLTFNTVIGTVKSVKNAFTSAKNAVKLFNATLLANPVALVISAIVGLAIIIYTYWDEIKAFTIVTWEAIKDFFVNLWESIKERVTTVWNSIKEFFGGLWTSIVEGAISSWNIFVDSVMAIIQPFIEGVVNVFNQMKEGLITIWENIKIYFENIWEIIKNIFLGAVLLLINLVTGNFEELKNNAIQIWNNIKNALKDIWDNLKNDAIQIWNNIKAWIQDTWENIKSTIKDAVKSVKETIKTAWENVKSNTKTALENVKTTITSIWESIKTFFTETLFDIWNSVKQKFQDIVNSVREKMKETKQKIVDGWNEAKSFLTNIDLKQIGKDIIQGLIKGIKSKVKAVADAVKDVADQITGKIKSILGIKSPSRVMRDQVGKWIPEGVAVGIEKNSKSAFRSMEGLSNGLYNAFDFKMPQVDIAGQISNIHRQSQRQISYDIQNELTLTKQPAYININIGGQQFSAFVRNITDEQAFQEARLNKFRA